jgi:hypothetical protein
VARRGHDELLLRACWRELGYRLFQVGVGHLVGAQLRAVAG